ncbi:MAG TPA: AraC family transcriptional regulator [Puia sp.]|uniref:AraC family transcriptional regulator n=1 Tax=Puia sp. TaxID=2045100 RepID=UPI002CFA474D|nr:AraC family transcriptional regulator [Puia sp.]HVU99642.1 AraC family transcriptional regulator [Puia sp.]
MKGQPYPRMYLYRRLVQAKLFIDTHYAEPIDLGAIADEAFFSKFHFIKQFKSIYRQTPHQYLISLRIEKARLLLKAGLPVSDVCYRVGFESLPSFSGLFKRMTGMTPSAYLAEQQDLKAQIAAAPLTYIPGCFAHKNGWLKK